MKGFKGTLLPVLFTILSLILIFTLELFLNIEETKILISIIFTISLILIIYGLVQIIVGKPKSKFLRGRRSGFLLIGFVFMFFIFTLNITAFNISIYEVFDGEFTALEKIDMYKTLTTASKEMKEYDAYIESYVKELNVDKINYIELYYDDEINIEHVNTIKETIPLAEESLEEIFGSLEKEPLKLIFYSDEEKFQQGRFKNAGFNVDLVQGYFDGFNIHIKQFMDEEPLWEIKHHLIHEYSHYIYYNYLTKNNIYTHLPVWFSEGIAEYAAYSEANMEYYLGDLANSIDLRQLQTTEEFSQALEEGQDMDKFYNPYTYAYYMVDSLVDMKGKKVIRDLILKSKDMDFYEAFESIIGVGIEEYQNVNLVEYIEKMSSL